MAESTKVRLVRCPKCENLLPELADYSVYQCGGCGAVLRAKIENREDGNITTAVVEKLGDESKVLVTNELQHLAENERVEISDASDTELKSNGCSLNHREMKCEEDSISFDDSRVGQSKATNGKWVMESGLDKSIGGDESVDGAGRGNHDLNSNVGHGTKASKSGRMSDLQNGGTGDVEGFRKIMRNKGEGVRFSSLKSIYPDEGPSNYCNLESSYSHREPSENNNAHDGSYRVQYLENDRMELLRKLDELKEQLSRSCGINEKPNDKIPLRGRLDHPDHYGSDTWCPGSSSTFTRASAQLFTPDKQAARPQYFSHNPEPFTRTHIHEMSMDNLYPSTYNSNHIPRYENHVGPQTRRRTSHQLPGRYQDVPPQYFSRPYVNTVPEPYPSRGTFHEPSCPCFHCCEKLYGVPSAVPPPACVAKRFADISNDPVMYHHGDPKAFNPLLSNRRATVPPPSNFHGAQSHARWPSDIKSEMDDFIRYRPRRVFLAGGGRCCRPVAGGAPLLTCLNCFEVLQLPRKLMLVAKDQKKMRCGACSAIMNLSVANGKLVLSLSSESAQVLKDDIDSSNKITRENLSYSLGHISHTNANFSSDDYDNSGYDFQTIDSDPIAPSRSDDLNLTRPQEMHNFHSSSQCTSEDENSPDVMTEPTEVIESIQQPIKESLSPPPPGSPLQQHFNYSTDNHVANRFGKGNCSSRSEQEKVVTNKTATRQNSMKDASMATEMEMSFHEYSNTKVSQDSGDASREDEQSKVNKGGESFLANIIKKSFKDFSKSNQTDDCGRSNVFVNGHLIPHRQVKKAEKHAGPVHPGKYWYDFQAGFWGVMYGPCLGIIPPSIEEFSYPMPKECAGGNTGVYVNGRELHQKDLDLLASRGLPTDRERSYIIEISGRVVDKDTNEVLESLGKLAPTVEKMKRGFGMKVPKVAS